MNPKTLSIKDWLRAFKRSWTLSDDIVIKGAELKDGILSVSLEKVIPEEDKTCKIKILKTHYTDMYLFSIMGTCLLFYHMPIRYMQLRSL